MKRPEFYRVLALCLSLGALGPAHGQPSSPNLQLSLARGTNSIDITVNGSADQGALFIFRAADLSDRSPLRSIARVSVMTNTPLTNGLRFSLPAPEAPADQVLFAAAYWPGLTVEAAVAKLMLPQLGSTTTAVRGEDFVNSQGVLLKWIQTGTFQMGSTEGTDPDRDKDEVQHTVTLTRGFWLSDHEVTQGEYQAVMGNNPSSFTGDLNRPVTNVDWNEAVSYCQKLTEQERASGRITAWQAYRLPTEAEWEYAARAGTTGARYTYNGYDVAKSLDYIAWYQGNSNYEGFWIGKQTHAVKQKAPNAWGLYDMIGNVKEWCSDWYGGYATGIVTDPTGFSSGFYRVFRGGGWAGSAQSNRSADRENGQPTGSFDFLGFRPALSAVQ